MTKEKVYSNFDLCSAYLDKLNSKQINALYDYLVMRFKNYDFMHKDMGRVAILHILVEIKCEAEDGDTFENFTIFDKFSEIWTFMLAMLMVQDEYNKYNPNYKSKLKR